MKIVALLAALLLVPAVLLADGPALRAELPEDAKLVEDVRFDDGDFIQTYQLEGGATVQLLRYGAFDMTLAELAEADWTGYENGEALALTQLGGYPAEGMRLTWGEAADAVRVTLVLVHADGETLIFQAVAPEAADETAVQAVLETLDVAGGAADEAEVG